MPVSDLVTTAGGTTSNAYVTIAVADQYHLDRPAVGTTWADAKTEATQAAIIYATTMLDSRIEWAGAVVTTTQALLWPRYGMYYPNGASIGSTVIPIQLQHATAEFARQLMADDRSGESAVGVLGLTEIEVDTIKLKFKDGAPRVVPASVMNLLPSDWGTVRGGTRELMRT